MICLSESFLSHRDWEILSSYVKYIRKFYALTFLHDLLNCKGVSTCITWMISHKHLSTLRWFGLISYFHKYLEVLSCCAHVLQTHYSLNEYVWTQAIQLNLIRMHKTSSVWNQVIAAQTCPNFLPVQTQKSPENGSYVMLIVMLIVVFMSLIRTGKP